MMPSQMGPVPYLDADAIRSGVPIADMLDAVEAAYRDVATGRDRSPIRSRVELPNGDLLLMPGVRDGSSGASVKLVTVMPANAGRGLPTIHALVVWLDAETGRPLALIDGETLTAMRTGAASGVATRLLARHRADADHPACGPQHAAAQDRRRSGGLGARGALEPGVLLNGWGFRRGLGPGERCRRVPQGLR